MIRDPMSADRNAQAPEGHPDAQVRIDQTNRLTGVQPTKYHDVPAPTPAPETPAEAETALTDTLDAPDAPAEPSDPAAPDAPAAAE